MEGGGVEHTYSMRVKDIGKGRDEAGFVYIHEGGRFNEMSQERHRQPKRR